MPIQNGKYVNPGWQNGGPPSIDANELNAISDTLEKLDENSGTTYTPGNGISIAGQTISAKISSNSNNSATFGTDGGIYVQAQGGGGKKYATFVIGTSVEGWTESDCDYLCDGTDDDVEFNEAISSLPQIGGEIVVLPGQYNISNTINMTGVTSAPPGRIYGAGSWSRSVRLVWTGQYTSSPISSSSSANDKNSIMNIQNGSVSNITFDMGNSSAASGNIGVSLGALAICEECYFINCPTSVKCSFTSVLKDCYIGGIGDSSTYGVYASGGVITNNFFSSYQFEYSIYTATSRYTPTLILGNILESSYSPAGGITCTGYGTATLVSNNVLIKTTISDETTTYHATIVNNVEC